MGAIDLQAKKMRQIMLICLLLTCSLPIIQASERARGVIGIDMVHMMSDNKASIYFSYSFSEHWSIEASSAVSPLISGKEILTSQESGISIQYWPKGYCNGVFISAGYIHERTRNPDIIIMSGLHIMINSSMGICVGLAIRAIESSINRSFCTESVRVGINYIF